jgi:uncharacterized protein
MTADLGTLCQSCGLCCDGSLFGRVPLDPDEVARARRHRLHVLDNGKAFEQPCTALSVGEPPSGARRVCSIYEDRPLSCRRFTCRLLARQEREGGPLEPRVGAVHRVRQLIAELQEQGLRPADFGDDAQGGPRPDAGAMDVYAELQKRLEEDFSRAC